MGIALRSPARVRIEAELPRLRVRRRGMRACLWMRDDPRSRGSRILLDDMPVLAQHFLTPYGPAAGASAL